MIQTCDLEIDGRPEDIQAVFDFIKVDKTQRSDNKNYLFELYETPQSEHSIITGFTDDKDFDDRLDKMYADDNGNHIYFRSYRKDLFKFVNYLSSKFLTCKFKLSWLEKYQGEENLFSVLVEKNCVIYYQRSVAYHIGPNMEVFLQEQHLDDYIQFHTRKEQEKTDD